MDWTNLITGIVTGFVSLITGLGAGYFGLRQQAISNLTAWQNQMLEETAALRQECERLRVAIRERDLHVVQLQGEIHQLNIQIMALRKELAEEISRRDQDDPASC